MNINPPFDEAGVAYQQTRKTHWDSVAKKRDHWRGMGKWYHRRLIEIYRYLVNPNQRILEIGCGTGGLIARLQPSRGVGIEFSAEMIARATRYAQSPSWLLCSRSHDRKVRPLRSSITM